ncbi:MAG: radical SAM protein [Anaerolineales bacterium]|nr:radical SAM protein [Anaerolineales bacterium]MCB9127624.1 radical SAM protein [Ardenticatenales bacterium]
MTFIRVEPDLQQKLSILQSEADDEQTAPPPMPRPELGDSLFDAKREHGGTTRLLKVLQTNACRYSCPYCFTSCAMRRKRTTFKPDELATTFISLHQQQKVEGLFLSTGIVPDADRAMEKMLGTVERLRLRDGYRGYIHLKLIPGASFDYVERAVQLADRVSLNLEAPNAARLATLAPEKEFDESMWQRMAWAAAIMRQAWAYHLPAAKSLTTQFVVGPAGEGDRELLQTVERGTEELGLTRPFFSAFRPIAESALADKPAEDPLRATRLYQASFLLRDYGFRVDELPFDAAGFLPRDRSPKQAWAESHLHEPVEVNRASRAELLRIPGLGHRSVARLLAARRSQTIRDLGQLRRLGAQATWAAPYLLLDGRRPLQQLPLF